MLLPLGLLLGYPELMAKSIQDIPNKRGRPSTGGRRDGVLVRFEDDRLGQIDNWAKQQNDAPSRPEAIRRLVELGLTVEAPRHESTTQKARAKEMAAGAIDKLTDSAAPSEEQASRKRRLLKGPEEFRGSRVDTPKAKP
ncbi:hypothetical protein [Tardiphaga sp.]|uniref:hypothetical protein n=1 Tax=Tardiphaga sp. TaxID=1926292 RepID=UPI00260DA745|nr:hypothetical protein [Tardiphaga sp.]